MCCVWIVPVVTKRGVRRPLSLEDSQKSLFLTQGISCRDGGAQIAWLDNLWLKFTSARLLQDSNCILLWRTKDINHVVFILHQRNCRSVINAASARRCFRSWMNFRDGEWCDRLAIVGVWSWYVFYSSCKLQVVMVVVEVDEEVAKEVDKDM